MDIRFVMTDLHAGMAAKRPAWKGYMKHAGDHQRSSADRWFRKFDVQFVPADDAADACSFTVTVDRGEVFITDLKNPMTLSEKLMEAFLARDWTIAPVEVFEQARTAGPTEDW